MTQRINYTIKISGKSVTFSGKALLLMTMDTDNLHPKAKKFLELLQTQRVRASKTIQKDFERREFDYIRALTLRLLGPYGVIELRPDRPGMVYVGVYLDGPAPREVDLARLKYCKIIAGASNYNDLVEQLKFLHDNDMLPRIAKGN